MTNEINNYLVKLIRGDGPISFADFTEIALYHPEFGYYIKKNPIGRQADFITAPSITSLFGETIAVWLLHSYELAAVTIKDFALVELGPGTGIMMRDILAVIKKFPAIYNNMSVHMVEISSALRAEQCRNLKDYISLNEGADRIFWHNNFEEIPKRTIFLVANEFLDALPVNRYQYIKPETGEGSWHENKISLAEEILKEGQEPLKARPIYKIISQKLELVAGARKNYNFPKKIPNNAIIERNFEGVKILQQVTNHLKEYGGNAVIIDYGYIKNDYRSTIQAVKEHKYCSIFDNIGGADITHEVDFGYLFSGYKCKIISQREFLLTYGIKERAELIAKNLNSGQKEILFLALERLLSKSYMGEQFKCALL